MGYERVTGGLSLSWLQVNCEWVTNVFKWVSSGFTSGLVVGYDWVTSGLQMDYNLVTSGFQFIL